MKKKLDKPILSLVKSNRAKQANGLVASCKIIVGDDELRLKGGLWRKYSTDSPDALRYAIQKWWALDPIRRRSIKHPAAWLTTVFQQAEKAFALSGEIRMNVSKRK